MGDLTVDEMAAKGLGHRGTDVMRDKRLAGDVKHDLRYRGGQGMHALGEAASQNGNRGGWMIGIRGSLHDDLCALEIESDAGFVQADFRRGMPKPSLVLR
jgi:hypothetical protein